MNRMEKTVTRSFSVVAGLLMGFLSLLSFCATGVNQTDLAWEKVYMQPDSLLVSLAGLIVSALIAGLVCHVAARWTPWQRRRWVIGVASGLTGLGLLWVVISKTVPQADQWMCCELAKAMNRGDYSSLQPGGYAAMYSHQLGLISWLRVLHVLFGEGMVVAFQIFNVLMIPLLVICGDQLIDEIVKPPLQRQAAGLLLTLFCLFAPMLLYTPFVLRGPEFCGADLSGCRAAAEMPAPVSLAMGDWIGAGDGLGDGAAHQYDDFCDCGRSGADGQTDRRKTAGSAENHAVPGGGGAAVAGIAVSVV